MAHDGSPEAVWRSEDGLSATLTHYAAGAAHPPHAHDHLQLSFLLAGSLEERLGRRDFAASAGWRGFKPPGAVHSDRWGEEGVLLFTLRFGAEAGKMVSIDGEPGWAPCASAMLAPLVRAFVRAEGAAARDEALLDLIALDCAPPPRPTCAPPSWLERARASLHEAPHAFVVAALADEAGVHRAQLSRMFRCHYGVPPSVYRRSVQLARAAAALARASATIASVAAEAGYYDQPHLNAALRQETGLTPAELRGLLRTRHPSKNAGQRAAR